MSFALFVFGVMLFIWPGIEATMKYGITPETMDRWLADQPLSRIFFHQVNGQFGLLLIFVSTVYGRTFQ